MNTQKVADYQIQRAAGVIVDFIESSGLSEELVMKSIMTSAEVRKTVRRNYDLIHNKNIPKFRKNVKEYFDTLFIPFVTAEVNAEFKKSEISKTGNAKIQAIKKADVILRREKLRLIEDEGIAIVKPGYVDAMQSGGNAARNIAGVKVNFDVLSPEALRYAQQNAAALIKEITEEARKAIKAIIVEGIKAGASNAQIANTIRGTIGLNGRWALAASRYRTAMMDLASAGKISLLRAKKRARRYAEKLYRARLNMIARTETAIAQAQGSLLSYKGIGVTHVRFYAAHGACAICGSMDGSIYRVENAFGVIPVHPNGRCDWLSIAPKKGYKYPSQTAPTVFANAEEQAIAEIMARFARDGKEHGAMFDTNGKLLSMFDGVKSHIFFTNDEMLLIRTYAKKFIHNHPGGSSFSSGDLGFGIANNLDEIWVVTPKHKYVFKLLEPDKLTHTQRQLYADKAETFHKKHVRYAANQKNYDLDKWIAGQTEKGIDVTVRQINEMNNVLWKEQSHLAMENTSRRLNAIGLKNRYVRTGG